MDLRPLYDRWLEVTGNAEAAATMVLAEVMAGNSRAPVTRLRVRDVAKELGVSPTKVRQWCRSGQLRATNLATGSRAHFVILREDLDVFLRSQSQAPPSARRKFVTKSQRF